jgi:ribosomal protein S16
VHCLKADTDEEFELQLKRLLEDKQLGLKLTENAHKLLKDHSLEKVGAQLKETYEYLVKK